MSDDTNQTKATLDRLTAASEFQTFNPHRIFRQTDAQTLSAFFWPGHRSSPEMSDDEEHLFEVEPGTRVLARCRWQPHREAHPALVIWHGMEGSTASNYMVSTARKAFRAGLHVIRVNIRSCGGTEHLTPTIYHGGLSADARVVIDELIKHERLQRIFLAGFSLGGNIVLKLGGEYGDNPPPQVKGICAVSPSINLRASSDQIKRLRNWIYHRNFLISFKRRIRTKKKLFPDLYNLDGLDRIRTIREFDATYVAPAFGFADVDDYYTRASSLPVIGRIRIPTLMIHAQDDPFIPFAPLEDPSIAANPYVRIIVTKRGGHVAFISTRTDGEDRFWAENRLVDFCRGVAGFD
jgi:uncharacterized protein